MPETGSDERSSPGTIDCDSAMDDAGVGSVSFPIRLAERASGSSQSIAADPTL